MWWLSSDILQKIKIIGKITTFRKYKISLCLHIYIVYGINFGQYRYNTIIFIYYTIYIIYTKIYILFYRYTYSYIMITICPKYYYYYYFSWRWFLFKLFTFILWYYCDLVTPTKILHLILLLNIKTCMLIYRGEVP